MAVLSLTWKSPYADKTVFILRRGPGGCLAIYKSVYTKLVWSTFQRISFSCTNYIDSSRKGLYLSPVCPRLISIRHWSDTFVLDWCLIDTDPKDFVIRGILFSTKLSRFPCQHQRWSQYHAKPLLQTWDYLILNHSQSYVGNKQKNLPKHLSLTDFNLFNS